MRADFSSANRKNASNPRKRFVPAKALVRAVYRAFAGIVILAAIFFSPTANAQREAAPSAPVATSEQLPPKPAPKGPAPCIQPAPMVRWQDYKGPFAKTVGIFARKLERKSVSAPHYIPGAVLCTLVLKDKIHLFMEDAIDPVTFLSAGFNAGISQAENNDPKYGQGAQGYGKRFGASLADQFSSEFFSDIVYPTIFSQDPRYYRLGEGGTGKRLLHAMRHVVVAHHENGKLMFNYTEWLGTASTIALGSVYHGYRRHGVAPAVEAGGYDLAYDMGFDILREFWPEIARKFKLPFRDESKPKR